MIKITKKLDNLDNIVNLNQDNLKTIISQYIIAKINRKL